MMLQFQENAAKQKEKLAEKMMHQLQEDATKQKEKLPDKQEDQ